MLCISSSDEIVYNFVSRGIACAVSLVADVSDRVGADAVLAEERREADEDASRVALRRSTLLARVAADTPAPVVSIRPASTASLS